MYAIYETEAFVLESRPRREADKIFTLYTEEFWTDSRVGYRCEENEFEIARAYLRFFSCDSFSCER